MGIDDWFDRPRDAALSLRFETRERWAPVCDMLGVPDHKQTLAAVTVAGVVEAQGTGRKVSYSRTRQHYELPHRYRDPLYTFTRIKSAVDWLDAEGLIDHWRRLPGQRGWQSSFRARPEMVDLLLPAMASGMAWRTPQEVVILKNDAGEVIDYRDNRVTNRMRRVLIEINEGIRDVELGGSNVELLRRPIRRIFKGGFELGGRLYAEGGAWQMLPKAQRAQVTIQGERVVEVDFEQIHPTLAYAEVGLPPPVDTYNFAGYSRSLCKVALNAMLNGRSPNGVRHSVAHHRLMAEHILGSDLPEAHTHSDFWSRVARLYPKYAKEAHNSAASLMEAIEGRHSAIASLFYTGAGMRFQWLDSQIAEVVVLTMIREGIVALPIHDSFLVPASKADLLEGVMCEAAARFGIIGKCKRSSGVPMG